MSEAHLALEAAFGHARTFLDSLPSRSVAPADSLDVLRKKMIRPLPAGPLAASAVIDELVADASGGIMGSQAGRFFSWVIGGSLPSAMAADWMVSAWDQNAGVLATSPAAAVAEEVAGSWLKELLGLPLEAGFAFVTGAQMAHVTCLASARYGLLARRCWDVGAQGLWNAPRVRVLTSPDRHASLDRALRLLGHGTACIEILPVDFRGRVTPEGLASALATSSDAAIVVLQAGELNSGGFDPFDRLVPIAHEAGAWVHVDGAFGLWARVSPDYEHLAKGIELCDSWATDAHKYLNVPFDSGIDFVRDPTTQVAAMSVSTSYLPESGSARSPIDWNPEFSRRARGFAVYAAIRELGKEGVAALVERTCGHARDLVSGLGRLQRTEVLAMPVFNQGLVRFRSGEAGATDRDDDAYTDRVIQRINASGEAFFGGVTWNGRRVMRISVCNWRTTEDDVARTVSAVSCVLDAAD
jgi:aromatic-L-amino-acid decarboxylase